MERCESGLIEAGFLCCCLGNRTVGSNPTLSAKTVSTRVPCRLSRNLPATNLKTLPGYPLGTSNRLMRGDGGDHGRRISRHMRSDGHTTWLLAQVYKTQHSCPILLLTNQLLTGQPVRP